MADRLCWWLWGRSTDEPPAEHPPRVSERLMDILARRPESLYAARVVVGDQIEDVLLGTFRAPIKAILWAVVTYAPLRAFAYQRALEVADIWDMPLDVRRFFSHGEEPRPQIPYPSSRSADHKPTPNDWARTAAARAVDVGPPAWAAHGCARAVLFAKGCSPDSADWESRMDRYGEDLAAMFEKEAARYAILPVGGADDPTL